MVVWHICPNEMKMTLHFKSLMSRPTVRILFSILIVCGGILWLAKPQCKKQWQLENDEVVIKYGKVMLEYGSAQMQVNLPNQDVVNIRYVIPHDPLSGKVLPSASTILFWAPYLGEAQFIQDGGLHGWARKYAKQFGWTVFTLVITDDKHVKEPPPSRYYCAESGWFEVVFAVKAALEKKYGLSNKKLIICGESAGGNMAERMVATYPEEIAAATWSGGTSYTDLPKSDVATFFFSNWGCPGAKATQSLAKDAHAHGISLLWTEIPPNSGARLNHHSPSQLTAQLKQTFLQGVVALANPVTGAIPPPEEWPCRYAMPDGSLIYLPSAEFARLWKKLPHA